MFNINNFWNEQHKKNNIRWLTGSPTEEIFRYHKIESIVNENTNLNVLDIGVGLGNMAKELCKKHNVISVDISQDALEKVKNISKIYLTKDMVKIDSESIDLAICHLVFQHCDFNMVSFIIDQTIRCLKDTGIFTFQFADIPSTKRLRSSVDYGLSLNSSIKRGTHHFMSIEKIKNIISKYNGDIIDISEPLCWAHADNIIWYFVKCKPL